MDPTPLAVHPRLPLETVMELFKKMGPRVILIEYRGKLTGLVTVKDCLKYQFKVEAHDNPQVARSLDEGHEKLWGVIKTVAGWANSLLGKATSRSGGGHGVRLTSPIVTRHREADRDRGGVGESEEDGEVELEDRGRGSVR